METNQFELPPFGTNAYLFLDSKNKEACLFDAPLDAWKTIEPELKSSNCKLTALLLTHGHWDHIGDCNAFSEQNIPIYAHAEDRFLLEEAQSSSSPLSSILPSIKPVTVTHFIEEGKLLHILGQNLEVRHVPGHSPGSILFYFAQHDFVISGDIIFSAGIGRTDFPYGNHGQLIQSIREKLLTLPEKTLIYPGHGPATNVAKERDTNPFLI